MHKAEIASGEQTLGRFARSSSFSLGICWFHRFVDAFQKPTNPVILMNIISIDIMLSFRVPPPSRLGRIHRVGERPRISLALKRHRARERGYER